MSISIGCKNLGVGVNSPIPGSATGSSGVRLKHECALMWNKRVLRAMVEHYLYPQMKETTIRTIFWWKN